jgi:hypothetical protein
MKSGEINTRPGEPQEIVAEIDHHAAWIRLSGVQFDTLQVVADGKSRPAVTLVRSRFDWTVQENATFGAVGLIDPDQLPGITQFNFFYLARRHILVPACVRKNREWQLIPYDGFSQLADCLTGAAIVNQLPELMRGVTLRIDRQ